MPIYEYECESCGNLFEKMLRIGADAPPCPTCESAQVHKRISASAFILKGGGWYKDHYGLKSGGSSSESGSGSSDAGSAKSESKAESKTESKAEPKAEAKSESKAEAKAPTVSAAK